MRKIGVISFIATSILGLLALGISSKPKPDWDGYIVTDEIGYASRDWQRPIDKIPTVQLSNNRTATVSLKGFAIMTTPKDTIYYNIKY